MAIGTLRCFVIDVEDLDVGAAFWSEVTGLPRLVLPEFASGWTEHAYLGPPGPVEARDHPPSSLHGEEIRPRGGRRRATARPRGEPRQIDITVEDVDDAIARIEAIGGRLKYPPTVYPVPHAYEGARPLIDWAVMQDPFGNEFCLVRGLTPAEREALAVAAEQGPAEDAHWRAVARAARYGG